MASKASASKGFTIVELLIVIVVIGILAAITIVSYSGVTNRANDVAVQSDLRNLADAVLTNAATSGTSTFPTTGPELKNLTLRVTKGSYGNHLNYDGVLYNLLYCSTTSAAPTSAFAFVASSKSGNVYAITSTTGVTTYDKAKWTAYHAGYGTICPDILNVAEGYSSAGLWFYANSIWQDYSGS